ncbi:hypothetical protein DPMN_011316 [Dreissena polymorpha]|uniref:Uncharacterized protein n=1 Tax=Dreissena polymorpha TaxID=45954 RepID=A0A9D4N1I2_DREPO|nr:hypothetical protein DPMN_011316 [Dreissena polymorpha]
MLLISLQCKKSKGASTAQYLLNISVRNIATGSSGMIATGSSVCATLLLVPVVCVQHCYRFQCVCNIATGSSGMCATLLLVPVECVQHCYWFQCVCNIATGSSGMCATLLLVPVVVGCLEH